MAARIHAYSTSYDYTNYYERIFARPELEFIMQMEVIVANLRLDEKNVLSEARRDHRGASPTCTDNKSRRQRLWLGFVPGDAVSASSVRHAGHRLAA